MFLIVCPLVALAGLCSMAGAALGSKMIRGMMLCVLILLLVKMITDMLQ